MDALDAEYEFLCFCIRNDIDFDACLAEATWDGLTEPRKGEQ